MASDPTPPGPESPSSLLPREPANAEKLADRDEIRRPFSRSFWEAKHADTTGTELRFPALSPPGQIIPGKIHRTRKHSRRRIPS